MFSVILKSLTADDQYIVLNDSPTKNQAEEFRKLWRKVLGNKHWHVDRRPGLDTLDHLALTVIQKEA